MTLIFLVVKKIYKMFPTHDDCIVLCAPTRTKTHKPIFHCDAKQLALRKICVGNTNMLVSNNAKICITPTPTPNASRWNIGGVASPMRGVGHVHFMFFVLISFALGTQRKRVLVEFGV